MKTPLYHFILLLLSVVPFSAFSQIPDPVIETIRTTDTSCNGMAILSNINDYPVSDYVWEWRFGSTVLQTGGDTTSGYCIGDYELFIHDLVNGGDLSTYFRIGPDCAIYGPTITSATIVNAVPGNDIGYICPNISGGFGAYTWNWSNGSTSMVQSGLSAGTYTFVVTDYYGCSDSAAYEVVVDSNGISPLDPNFYITFEGPLTLAMVNPTGGIPPYETVFSSGSIIDGNGGSAYDPANMDGLQYATCYDSGGDSVIVHFIVSAATETYGYVPYPDSIGYNAIYCGLVENCDIDYASVDTAYIYDVVFDSTAQQLYITWVVSSITDTVFIIDTADFLGVTGVYTLNISAYCPQKSTGDHLTILGQMHFDHESGGFLGAGEIVPEQVFIAPNPFDREITIYGIKQAEITVFNAVGQQIAIEATPNANGIRVNFAQDELVSGLYYVRIVTGNREQSFKLAHY